MFISKEELTKIQRRIAYLEEPHYLDDRWKLAAELKELKSRHKQLQDKFDLLLKHFGLEYEVLPATPRFKERNERTTG